MFYILEIDKRQSFTGIFTPIAPYIYKTLISVTESSKTNYWTTLFNAENNYNSEQFKVNSVVINLNEELLEQESYSNMESQEGSFYFNFTTQSLYIHLEKDINPFATSLTQGILRGYSNDTVRYFNNQEYKPLITSIPTISEDSDPLQYSAISFSSGSVTLSNPVIDNEFLFNGDEDLYGNNAIIKRGEDGNAYADLTTVFSGYVNNATTSTTEEVISIYDNRSKLEIDYPTETFVTDEDDDLIGDTNNKLIPDGYGNVIQAKAYPYRTNIGSVTYRWCKKATSISHVYAYQDESLNEVVFNTDTNSPLETGFFYIGDAEAYVDGDNTKGLVDIYVTGRMRDYDNPADIIKDLNSVILGVEYNSTNYNTTEWETEKAYLADVALYMDKEKSFYEWVEELQAGSNYGFRYEDSEKRTIRVDLKDRDLITFDDGTTKIMPIDIRNSSIEIDQNADLYASSVTVKYAYNSRKKTYSSVINSDYYNDVLREFRVASNDSYETLLTTESDAIFKASLIAKDESTVRPLIKLTIEASKYTTPRIYDILEAQASLLVQSAYQSEYTNVLGDDDVLGDDYALGELFGLTYNEASSLGQIDYYGEFVGQVLGITHNTSEDTVTLTLRDITNLRS